MAILNNDTQVSVVVDGLDHPEGVAWGLDGYVYAGGEEGQIYRIDLDKGSFTEIVRTGGFMGGLALDADGNIYACNAANHKVFRITPDGSISDYASDANGEQFTTPNYPVFDAEGNLYLSDSGDFWKDNGRIYKIRPGGNAEVWCRALREFPNGMCLSPDGDFLYVVLSFNTPRVARVFIEPDGSAGGIQIVAHLTGAVPDGLAFDTEGNLYISCYRPDRIYRLSPDSKLEILAEEPTGHLIAAPTNVAFCGPNLDKLLSTNLGRWHLTKYDVGKTGLRLNYPRIS